MEFDAVSFTSIRFGRSSGLAINSEHSLQNASGTYKKKSDECASRRLAVGLRSVKELFELQSAVSTKLSPDPHVFRGFDTRGSGSAGQAEDRFWSEPWTSSQTSAALDFQFRSDPTENFQLRGSHSQSSFTRGQEKRELG